MSEKTEATATDWQRPPFELGNEAAVTHGARSPRKIEEVARRISGDLLERAPWIENYPETLTALARAEAVTQMLFRDVASGGLYDKKGQFKASQLARWAAAENTAARLRQSLGMTPESEAAVARDRAAAASSTVDVIGELVKQGRATRAAQLVQDLPALTEPVTEPESGKDEA